MRVKVGQLPDPIWVARTDAVSAVRFHFGSPPTFLRSCPQVRLIGRVDRVKQAAAVNHQCRVRRQRCPPENLVDFERRVSGIGVLVRRVVSPDKPETCSIGIIIVKIMKLWNYLWRISIGIYVVAENGK